MLNVALFGPPGAGKGTQSEFLVKEYGLFYLSTGDLLRKEMAAGTRLGEEARSVIASGGLVSDEIIVQVIEKAIVENPEANGFLFDGFPRTWVQCYILEGLLLKLGASLDLLVSLEVDAETSVSRLVERGRSSGRLDDNEEVIRNRLREYEDKTLPVLGYFKEKGVYRAVDGTASIPEVSGSIRALVREELSKRPVNVVLFGYPGSGRGSQGAALAREYGLEYVSTGAMLDREIKLGTETGKRIMELYDSGELVPDEIVVRLIEKRLAEAGEVRGFIFKGFPRTLVQSYILDGLLRKRGGSVSTVIDLEVPTLELIKRLDIRSKTDRAMPYDLTTARIVQRLKEHESKTVPVIEKYAQRHGVEKVDGTGSFEEVFARLSAVLERALKGNRG